MTSAYPKKDVFALILTKCYNQNEQSVCVCECGWGKNTGTDEEMRPKNRERAPKKKN